MIKWLVVIGVVGAIYFLFIKKKPAVANSKRSSNKAKKEEDESASNDMVECATCSVYCEIDDAILSNNKYYCSDECLAKV